MGEICELYIVINSCFPQIFNDYFQDVCTMLNNRKTDTHLVTYKYLIFQKKTGIFMDGVKLWCGKTDLVNFNMHMRSEYLALQEVRGAYNKRIHNESCKSISGT